MCFFSSFAWVAKAQRCKGVGPCTMSSTTSMKPQSISTDSTHASFEGRPQNGPDTRDGHDDDLNSHIEISTWGRAERAMMLPSKNMITLQRGTVAAGVQAADGRYVRFTIQPTTAFPTTA